jgi:metallo-beta-lactamase family protein
MAANAMQVYLKHKSELRLTAAECDALAHAAHIVQTPEESRLLNARHGPMVIISASGMATGGRVVHHLKALAPDARNTILLTGHQAVGTRGAAILGGARAIKIHGQYVPVSAEVALLDNLSAHADAAEILDWLHHFHKAPLQTFITHGEPGPADALRLSIEETLGWAARVPDYMERTFLGGDSSRYGRTRTTQGVAVRGA